MTAGQTERRRVVMVTTTTGYQARAFEAAATELGIELVYATDRCHVLEDPWRDGAVAIDFADEYAAATAIVDLASRRPVHGVLAAGDRAARIAAAAAEALGLPWHTRVGAHASTSKLQTRGRLLGADLPVPWFFSMPPEATLASVADRLRFPCIIKPVALTASRGVIRVDDPASFESACDRVRAIVAAAERDARTPGDADLLVEGFIPGHELALEGVLEHGALRVLAIFDKPDPLDGPFFAETIYVTPPPLTRHEERAMAGTIAHAAAALGLRHGPIHAECRINAHGVFILEIAPRPIGGLCARALRFTSSDREGLSLEEILLRHAVGDSLDGFGREAGASGVLMLTVPRAGRLRAVHGVAEARALTHVEDVVITARPGESLTPLPEGASYPGFVFARADDAAAVTAALRAAQGAIRFEIDSPIPMR
jgi:biotin carboxylase